MEIEDKEEANFSRGGPTRAGSREKMGLSPDGGL